MTMVERMVEIICRENPDGMEAAEVEQVMISEPNCPHSMNLRGYIASVLSAARDPHGERVFEAVERGVYVVRRPPPMQLSLEFYGPAV